MNISILQLNSCLLSSVYGFFDILEFVRKKFAADIQNTILNKNAFLSLKNFPDVLYIPAFLYIDPDNLLAENSDVISMITKLNDSGTTICSVCAGAFLLLESGIAAGKQITTHWSYFDIIEKRYPNVIVNRNKILIDNEIFITGGGITSFQDLALYLVKKHCSEEMARTAAKYFLINPHKHSQREYIIHNLPNGSNEKNVHSAIAFIKGNFKRPVSLRDIAEASAMSERTLMRKFKSSTGMTPGECLKRNRIEYAKELLETTDLTVEYAANACGYLDVSVFYRAFKSEVGLTPGEYRNRYS